MSDVWVNTAASAGSDVEASAVLAAASADVVAGASEVVAGASEVVAGASEVVAGASEVGAGADMSGAVLLVSTEAESESLEHAAATRQAATAIPQTLVRIVPPVVWSRKYHEDLKARILSDRPAPVIGSAGCLALVEGHRGRGAAGSRPPDASCPAVQVTRPM
jgi:hypothetical protein